MSFADRFKRLSVLFPDLRLFFRGLAASGFVIGLLAGCSILPETAPQRVYQLPGSVAPAPRPQMAVETAPSLRVSTPSSPLILASNRILVMNMPNQLAAFKGVRWSDPMPQLFQQRLVSYLRESNNWRVVTTDDTTLSNNYQLSLDLAQFHAIRMPQSRPGVEIRVDAILSRRSDNKAVASHTFLEKIHAKSDAFDDLLTAYGEAANAISVQISDWAQQQAHRK
jgi:cholesterol transport system auxiliary component|tara:strand:+ start:173635 stop:174306 length:672 start_codon:yes stop_codon:yes gene_type:complete